MKNKIFFIMFITVWIIIVIINFIWPKQVFSEEENRMLATIPRFSFSSFINGDYLNGVNDYINDHFAFRNIYLKLNSFWETSVMGKTENNDVYIGKDGYLFEKFSYEEEEKKNVIDASRYEPIYSDEDSGLVGENKNIFRSMKAVRNSMASTYDLRDIIKNNLVIKEPRIY